MSHGKVWHSFFVEYKLWRGAVYGRAVIQNGITVLLIQQCPVKDTIQGKTMKKCSFFVEKNQIC